MKLGELTNSRNNNLDALRLIAAFMVLYSHSLVSNTHTFSFYNGSIGWVGLEIFFIISGFLITQSFLRQSYTRFLWGRILRIFPALILVVLVSVFIIGPLFTNSPDYFDNKLTYSYLINATLFDYSPSLPGVFYGDTNISLWTLRYEFLLYLLVMLIGMVGLLRSKWVVVCLFTTSLLLDKFGVFTDFNNWDSFSLARINVLTVYFSAGMLIYLYKDKIVLSVKRFFIILSMLFIGWLIGGFDNFVWVFILGYIVFFIGYYPKINLRWATQYGDFSYGIYIWSSILLNITWYFFGRDINPYLAFIMAGSFAYIIGALSWHLIEKKALLLKNITMTGHPQIIAIKE